MISVGIQHYLFLFFISVSIVFSSIFEALLEISDPIKFSPTVQPICIANDKQNGISTYESVSATIAGWGNVKEELDIGSHLKYFHFCQFQH